MASKTLTEDQVVVARSSGDGNPKGTSGGSDADQEKHGGTSDRGTSDHSADSDQGSHDESESGSTTNTPVAPDSSDRAPSQPR